MPASSSAVSSGVLPPSTMLASSGAVLPSCLGNLREIVARARRLDEQDVGARLGIEPPALDRAVEVLDRRGVGAADDQRRLRLPRIDRRPDLARHLRRGNDRLAGEMPAALGEHLVLELDRRGPCPLEQPHRPLHVERVAVAGVGIDDQRAVDAVAHQRDRFGNLGRGDEPDIGPPEPAIGDGRAGEIERVEAGCTRRCWRSARHTRPARRRCRARARRPSSRAASPFGLATCHHGHALLQHFPDELCCIMIARRTPQARCARATMRHI